MKSLSVRSFRWKMLLGYKQNCITVSEALMGQLP